MADWDAFRSELEGAETRQPPMSALRERRRRRQQRKAIAGTLSVVLVGSATGLAVLGQNDAPRNVPTVSALNPVVTSTKLPPPPDYTDYVVTDVDFVSGRTGWALGLRCQGDRCDVATWRTDDGGDTWGAPLPVATGVPRSTYHDEDPSGGAVRSIRMLDGKVGYAYNPDLYVTRDGARSWTRLPRRSKVTSVASVAPGEVWVTERGCAAGVDCDLVVTVDQHERSYGTAIDLPETNGARAIVRTDGGGHAYLVTWQDPAGGASFWRKPPGSTWHRGEMPCQDAEAVSLSARPHTPLWLVCTSPAGRTAWRSTTSGASWEPVPGIPSEGVVTDVVGVHDTSAYVATQTPGAIWRFHSETGWSRENAPKAYGYANLEYFGPGLMAMGDAGDLWFGSGPWRRVALPPAARRAPSAPPIRGLNDASVAWSGVAFLDAKTGWAAGERCVEDRCTVVTARTDDGGVTWAATDPTHGAFRSRTPTRVWRIRLLDARSGWVWSPGEPGFRSETGGRTWQGLGEDFRDIRFGRGPDGRPVAWALYADRLVADATGPSPRSVWEPRDAPLLAVGDADHAYLLGESVFGTADRGITWYEGRFPCSVGSVSAYAPLKLWAVCRATGDASQRQARSSDGGRTWTLSDLPGTGAATGEIVALSDTYAWRTGANRGVLVTRDGGRTWTGSPHVPDHVVSMTFADERHGWLVAGNVLYRTTDGVTWERLG